ncbi:MAG: acylphosphatase [Chloroflexi bacterium]|nr:acylphosphatase [Chloroflexota bacterium]
MEKERGLKRVEATVYGRVQGVSFRYYTQLEARRLGINGWVANRPDRSVHTVAEAPEDSLRKFIDFLHRGPPMAWVENVDVRWQEASGEFRQFAIRW